MNKLGKLILGALLVTGGTLLMTCADPLEVPDKGPITGPVILYDSVFDTTVIHDTINVGDSTVIIDTVIVIDTIFEGDTTTIYDTVIVTDTIVDFDTVTVIDTFSYTDTLIVTDTINDIDTLFVIDTVNTVDTLLLTDTLTMSDTVFVSDTVTIIDTVIVMVPDSTPPTWLCSRIASNQQEVIWMLRNEPGRYRLEFSAVTERDQPSQSVTIDIDGTTYQWPVGQVKEYLAELELDAHSIVTITSNVPPARGHSIDICLTITAL